MSEVKASKVRKATQLLVCRAVLAEYLEGERLEECLTKLRLEMRTGHHSWAFKPHDPPDDRVYYEVGGE